MKSKVTVDSRQLSAANWKLNLDLMIYAYNGQLNSVSFSPKNSDSRRYFSNSSADSRLPIRMDWFFIKLTANCLLSTVNWLVNCPGSMLVMTSWLQNELASILLSPSSTNIYIFSIWFLRGSDATGLGNGRTSNYCLSPSRQSLFLPEQARVACSTYSRIVEISRRICCQ